MPFSTELRARRAKAGLSLREAAKCMQSRGAKLSFSMLCRYEHGRGIGKMSFEHMRAIGRLLRWNTMDMSNKIEAELAAQKEKATA